MKTNFNSKAINSLLILFTSLLSVEAQNIVRGPYLQSLGHNSIIVRWRTDLPTNSRAYYGTNKLTAMVTFADDTVVTTEHIVRISGLSPKTKYYYKIGSSAIVIKGPSDLMHFTTAPEPTSGQPVRFWAIGDFGHGNLAQRLVRNSYLNFAATERPADFHLWLGDNVYDDGTDLEYQNKVFDSINGYYHLFQNLPFFPTSGNHDYNSICPWQSPTGQVTLCPQDPYTHAGPYLDLISPPTKGELGGTPSNLKLYYSFDFGDIHFVSLNSELGSFDSVYNWAGVLNNDTNFTSPMLEWLKTDLASTTKKWKVVFWHQCPYSGQNNFTDGFVQIFCIATRKHFNPIIEKYGVDLVLTGHDHNFQRSYLINGHYDGKTTFDSTMMINGKSGNADIGEAYIKYTDGPLADKGAVYAVVGNSSGSNGASPFVHPAIYYGDACDDCFGSLIVDVDGNRLDGRYLTSKGTILDKFTIIKQSVTSINETKGLIHDFKVYPNPFANTINVNFNLEEKAKTSFDILSIDGRIVYSISPKNLERGTQNETIDLSKSNLAIGSYIVRINCNGTFGYRKIQKMN
jgi:hypothetical protein